MTPQYTVYFVYIYIIFRRVYKEGMILYERMKKRHFHCEKCGSEIAIYRKGKKHRVMVCPGCGILASNPIPQSIKKGAYYVNKAANIGLGALPVIGSIYEESGLRAKLDISDEEAIARGIKKGALPSPVQKVSSSERVVSTPHRTHSDPLRKIELAMR